MTSHRLRRQRGGQALRIAVVAGCAVLLAACNSSTMVTGSVADDYRERHPVVIKEGPRTVDLFIGEKRGNLTGAQRAEVVAFAREWRREASGGIMIDIPAGTSNAAAPANASAEARSLLAAAGVPVDAVRVREHRPSNPGKLATLRLHYPRMMADVGPCGLWPDDLGPTFDRIHSENREYAVE